jgi:hypothetical protein
MSGYTKKLKQLLREAGCSYVRQGKGDHEIWRHPERFIDYRKQYQRELCLVDFYGWIYF